MRNAMNKALFLDRDGVINIDYGYVHKKENFVFIDGIYALIRAARSKGYLVIVVTNQAGIGRGYYTERDFEALMDWVNGELQKQGTEIDAVYQCPYHPVHGIDGYKKDSPSRKPGPGMMLQAAREHAIDLPTSVMVGDSPKDIQAGAAAGVGKLCFYSESGFTVAGARTVTRLTDVIDFL